MLPAARHSGSVLGSDPALVTDLTLLSVLSPDERMAWCVLVVLDVLSLLSTCGSVHVLPAARHSGPFLGSDPAPGQPTLEYEVAAPYKKRSLK